MFFGLGHKNLRDVSTVEELEEGRKKMSENAFKRAHHVVTERQRTETGARALENNDYEEFGRLMYESHDSLKNDFQVSCEELDQLVELARSVDGVFGSRMTGAGFGKRDFFLLMSLCENCLFSRRLYGNICEKRCCEEMY